MMPDAEALLAHLASAADEAKAAETELRRAFASELQRLERRRTYAFRRKRLIEALLRQAACGEEEPGEEHRWEAQRRAVTEALGWSRLTPSYIDILARLKPVGDAVCAHLEAASTTSVADVMKALGNFESWFEATHHKSFYALFDQYVQEVPIVDF